MFATIRAYRVNPIFEHDFIKSWHKLLNYLKEKNLVSYGVLNKESKMQYISYVQWNSKEEYKTILTQKSDDLQKLVDKTLQYCNSEATIYRLTTIAPPKTNTTWHDRTPIDLKKG